MHHSRPRTADPRRLGTRQVRHLGRLVHTQRDLLGHHAAFQTVRKARQRTRHRRPRLQERGVAAQ